MSLHGQVLPVALYMPLTNLVGDINRSYILDYTEIVLTVISLKN